MRVTCEHMHCCVKDARQGVLVVSWRKESLSNFMEHALIIADPNSVTNVCHT